MGSICQELRSLSMNRVDEGKEVAKKCIMQLYIEDNPQKFLNYKNVIEKAFNIEVEDLIKF